MKQIAPGVWISAVVLFLGSLSERPALSAEPDNSDWIRASATFPGRGTGMIWHSPSQRIWAHQWSLESYTISTLFNGAEGAKYVYEAKKLIKVPLRPMEAARVQAVEPASSEKFRLNSIIPGLVEQIVGQQRREVMEQGKSWIEYLLYLNTGRSGPATLRIDPATRLPVTLTLAGEEKFVWRYDAPGEGPADIYALGAPRNAKIDDRMPGPEAARLISEMRLSRARIGDYRMMVYGDDRFSKFIYWRKGNRWRVDYFRNDESPAEQENTDENRDWNLWFAEQMRLQPSSPRFICDGDSVWENAGRKGERPKWRINTAGVAPMDIGSGEQSAELGSHSPSALVYPEILPDRGDQTFEFDPAPTDAPGQVRIKISSLQTDDKRGHVWFDIDPAFGYAVTRRQYFTLPRDAKGMPDSDARRTVEVAEDFQQAPEGYWYPSRVHRTSGFIAPDTKQFVPTDEIRRYHFDFLVEMPDSLFVVDNNEAPVEPQPKKEDK